MFQTQHAVSLLLEMLKYFEVMSNVLNFSHVKEVVQIRLVCEIFQPVIFLGRYNNTKLVLASIFYFLDFLWEKKVFYN